MLDEFQSTHPLRGATFHVSLDLLARFISIHAPLAGCDGNPSQGWKPCHEISIHAPLAGCDGGNKIIAAADLNFNPRTPCGVRRAKMGTFTENFRISIHAPLAGCDAAPFLLSCHHIHFNPRTPCGVRHRTRDWHAELDDFNPRTPCGVRHRRKRGCPEPERFQSTHPLRGATNSQLCEQRHEPYFNPRTPCGVRPSKDGIPSAFRGFQSTHPLRGATALPSFF